LRLPSGSDITAGVRRLFALLLAASAALAASGLAGSMTPAPKVTVTPLYVSPGNAITITGSHFRPRLRVTLTSRLATSTKRFKIGSVLATSAGRFRFSKTLSTSTAVGKYVLRACQRTCRTKATAVYHVRHGQA
jgi:hypothetical protein